jgi:hypothetical protein
MFPEAVLFTAGTGRKQRKLPNSCGRITLMLISIMQAACRCTHREAGDWIKNKIRAIVCTNAFGRVLINGCKIGVHIDPPESFEQYYQKPAAQEETAKSIPRYCYTMTGSAGTQGAG